MTVKQTQQDADIGVQCEKLPRLHDAVQTVHDSQLRYLPFFRRILSTVLQSQEAYLQVLSPLCASLTKRLNQKTTHH